ncbi:hypothetical protein IWQ54_006272 [Labrenzia sp. EL_195]|nr:hypothetical protein [Labrenzia sp. EL_195]
MQLFGFCEALYAQLDLALWRRETLEKVIVLIGAILHYPDHTFEKGITKY